ncbi:MAG: BTAD domain-containing putative transcriptional regulator [Gaiellaceae bacterium]
MEFRILGPLEAVDGGRLLPLGGARRRTLLVLLLTRANEVVSSDRLIDELWGAQPPHGAANALQNHVSQLRKVLPPDTIRTREPGYLIHVERDQLDLLRFEALVSRAQAAPAAEASDLLREALELWRGPPLSDLAQEPFAQAEIRRLEELRLEALERRFEAELSLGRHAALAGELERLAADYPFRERLRGQLMRALYASGRQAEALEVYRQTRRALVDELGIEPGPALQELEQAMLRHDPGLTPATPAPPPEPGRTRAILVVFGGEPGFDGVLGVAEPLARNADRELILTRLLADDSELAAATTALARCRAQLAERGVSSRVAAFTTVEPGCDAARLATEHDVDLTLAEADVAGGLDPALVDLLERAPCDVALMTPGRSGTGPIVTPFGGVENEWSAIELAAWLARSLGTTLRLVGTEANAGAGRRDASRLLARASLLVQQFAGIVTEPALVPAGEDGVLGAAGDARLLVIGLSDRWRSEGLGHERSAIAARTEVPVLFVRRGLRPGGVAPDETATRFTWTLASAEP